MKLLILTLAVISLLGCTDQTFRACTCVFNGTKYEIHQNSKGAIYGEPVR